MDNNSQCKTLIKDYAIAQYPNELVTYGGNGQVFSNWIQFRLTMHYLSILGLDIILKMPQRLS